MGNTSWGFYRMVMLGLALAFISAARAEDVFAYNIRLTTSSLSASGGSYTLGFEFNNGDAIIGNNTIKVANFDLGGGTTTPALPSTLTLTDGPILNGYQFSWVPGDHISFTSFTLTMTNMFSRDPNTLSPDEFSFSILDGLGNDINTKSPNGSFITIDTSEVGGPQSASAYSSSSPDPDITATIVAVPEPSIWLLFCSACVLAMIPQLSRKSDTRSLRKSA